MNGPSASLKVLYVPELLALIFSHLPQRDLLLTAQRINQTCRTLIQTSIPLQERLFFLPSASPEPVINPLLVQVFGVFFKPALPNADEWQKHEQATWIRAQDFDALPWKENPAAFRRKEASWKRMLVVTGGEPMREVKVTDRHMRLRDTSSLQFHTRMALLDQAGLKMSVLWEIAISLCNFGENERFWVRLRSDVAFDGVALGRGKEEKEDENEREVLEIVLVRYSIRGPDRTYLGEEFRDFPEERSYSYISGSVVSIMDEFGGVE